MNKRLSVLAILTSVSGNALEWYDFALYGYFASIIAKLFFPAKSEFISLMITFGVFASGFIVRPFGGAIFGYIGDRYGRRIALVLSIAIITIPTTLMGILPSYTTLGIFSPIIFTLLRFLQGLAVSGELTGSGVFLVESASSNKRGFYGSLVMCSTYFGLLLGSGLGLLVTVVFSKMQIISYAWRIPFLLSFPLGALALILRIKCQESPMFIDSEINKKLIKTPIRNVFSNYLPQMILIFLLSSTLAVAIYLLIGYLPTFYVSSLHISLRESMLISFLGLLVLSIMVPISGFLSDKFNKKIIFGFGAFGFILFSYAIFYLMSEKNILSFILSEFLIALFLSPIAGSLIAILSEMFPTNVRYTGVSIAYNISMMIFGGTTPLVAMYLTNIFKTPIAPAYYLSFIGIITLISLVLIKPKYTKCMS